MDITDLKNHYADLLIIQYRLKGRARKTIELSLSAAAADGLPLDLARCFDLDTAEGAQLDILGRIVGISRHVYGLDLSRHYFSFARYADAVPAGRPGFGRYLNDPYPNNFWRRYIENSVLAMTDFEMRECIKIKIIQNNAYSSLKNIVDLFYESFGSDILITDNKDMTMEYRASEAYRKIILIAEYLDILPRPMCVDLTVTAASTSSSSCSSSSLSSSSSSCRSSSSSSCRSSSSSCRSSSSSSSSAA